MALVDRAVNGYFSFVTWLAEWLKRRHQKKWFTKKKIFLAFVIVIAAFCIYYVFANFVKFFGMPASVYIVKERKVPVYMDYVGMTQSPQDVMIRARVEGFLDKQGFKDGANVKKGDLLFVIDKKPFIAQLNEAKGQLAKDEAALAYAREQVKRYEPLAEKDYISR